MMKAVLLTVALAVSFACVAFVQQAAGFPFPIEEEERQEALVEEGNLNDEANYSLSASPEYVDEFSNNTLADNTTPTYIEHYDTTTPEKNLERHKRQDEEGDNDAEDAEEGDGEEGEGDGEEGEGDGEEGEGDGEEGEGDGGEEEKEEGEGDGGEEEKEEDGGDEGEEEKEEEGDEGGDEEEEEKKEEDEGDEEEKKEEDEGDEEEKKEEDEDDEEEKKKEDEKDGEEEDEEEKEEENEDKVIFRGFEAGQDENVESSECGCQSQECKHFITKGEQYDVDQIHALLAYVAKAKSSDLMEALQNLSEGQTLWIRPIHNQNVHFGYHPETRCPNPVRLIKSWEDAEFFINLWECLENKKKG
ncbi:unnamed protein product [Notodromas monacha]|uniref:Uncharacterized protein n=1 Tax=Notodromas monacha TaxID=399045 RepID=A0A7R9BTX5_9CRUS|nr:unnamed protein product [Notodromas monacha]CAG0920616.1 unnamed protein product [Notodromas monacha]